MRSSGAAQVLTRRHQVVPEARGQRSDLRKDEFEPALREFVDDQGPARKADALIPQHCFDQHRRIRVLMHAEPAR